MATEDKSEQVRIDALYCLNYDLFDYCDFQDYGLYKRIVPTELPFFNNSTTKKILLWIYSVLQRKLLKFFSRENFSIELGFSD